MAENGISCILLNIGTLDFFDILHEVRDLSGVYVDPKPFLRKILFLQILAIFGNFWLKNTLSGILLNIGTLDFFDILHEIIYH